MQDIRSKFVRLFIHCRFSVLLHLSSSSRCSFLHLIPKSRPQSMPECFLACLKSGDHDVCVLRLNQSIHTLISKQFPGFEETSALEFLCRKLLSRFPASSSKGRKCHSPSSHGTLETQKAELEKWIVIRSSFTRADIQKLISDHCRLGVCCLVGG